MRNPAPAEPGFIRTSLPGAPMAVNMARALMLHAMAVLDEMESLSEAEFVEVCAAFVPLLKKVHALPGRVDWHGPDEMALQEPAK